MARSRCACGEQLLWKADEPESDEWLLVAKPDLPHDLNDLNEAKHAAQTSAAFCSHCGRLWVAWGDGGSLSEYVPVDPATRAVRKTKL